MEHLILASASPQRKTLLEGLGLRFEIVPSMISEKDCLERDPRKRSLILASNKAKDVASHRTGAWVIGCDTLVVASDGTLLEKPVDAEDARRMLRLLSGQICTVHSGLSLISPEGHEVSDVSSSSVTFKKISGQEEEWWIGTKNWEGRSGGFQIDGPGQLLISRIDGDWTGIVGLPVFLLGELMRKAKAPFLSE